MYVKRILIGLLIVLLVAAAVGGILLIKNTQNAGTLQINIRGDRQIYVECNRPYMETGAYAMFKKGDESRQVPVAITGDTVDTSEMGTYLLKYTATWEDRVVTSYRSVQVRDTEKPQLQLVGGERYYMSAGQPYAELGFTATDNYDGDLSKQVQVVGEVDRFTPGEYILTYTVTDSNNNTASVSRTVRVEAWNIAESERPRVGTPNGKVIYLTFDDGPGKNTPRLLNVLKKYNIKATFFVTNTGYINTIKRIAQEGHTLAMHTTTHVYKSIYASEDAYFKDLDTIRGIIKNLTGQESKILRFPGGSSNKSSKFNPGIMTKLTKLVEEKGYTYFDWNVDSKDAGGAKTPEEVFYNVTSSIIGNEKDFYVVLQHDIKSYSIDAVESIIIWGLENGYTFLALNENSPTCHHTVRN